MRFAILGTGGVGGYFGGRLLAAGHDVVFLARGAHFDAIATHGLRIRSANGDLSLDHADVVDEPSAIRSVDVVLMTVKLADTDALLPHVTRLAHQGAVVISLQNGVDKDDMLAGHVPPHQVIGGVCFINAHVEAPGIIVHTGTIHRLILGEYTGDRPSRLRGIVQAFTDSGVDAETSPDIRTVIWEKFVFLVGFSAMTAASGAPIGSIRNHEPSRRMLRRIFEEGVTIAAASGVHLSDDFPARQLAFCDTLADGARASMAHDIQAGRPSELRWLSGWVVDAGRRLGVDTPMNEAVVALLGARTAA